MARDALRFELAALGRKLRDQGDDSVNEDTGEPETSLMIGLRAVKRQELKAALGGNMTAIKEISDRLDGKPPQALEVGGIDGKPIDMNWVVEVIAPQYNEEDSDV